MTVGRREFLRCSGLTMLGAVIAVSSGCGSDPAAPPPTRAGQELMKVGLYTWDEISYLPKQIDWLDLTYARAGGMSDQLMRFCVEKNIEVLVNVTPTADRTTFGTDAEFVSAYLTQVDVLLTRYGPRGTFWSENPTLRQSPVTQLEVCNEPNFGYGFGEGGNGVAPLYAQVLIASYDHVKARWPEVLVVGFAAGGASNAAPDFMSAAFEALRVAGNTNCFDVVSFHPYSSNKPPEEVIVEEWGSWSGRDSIDAIRQIMMEYGVTKPLWITEVGYQISRADGGQFTVDILDSAGQPETVTTAQQAAYTIRVNMAAARFDVPRVYHMFTVDSDNYNGGWFGAGPTHDARPVAVAMRQVIGLLDGADGLEVVLDGADGEPGSPFAYRFSTPRGSVLVAWCQVPGTFKLQLPAGAETVVTDMLGNQLTVTREGTLQAALSEAPIFLHSSTS